MIMKKGNSQKDIILAVLAICILSVFAILSHKRPYQHDEGTIFGTIYHITYQSGTDYKTDIERQLRKVDGSLSMFNDTSLVSKINRNIPVTLDPYFITVFNKAKEVSKISNGAFDTTVAPLVNAWGFGFKNYKNVNQHTIDSLRQFVGYDKISIVNGKIVKKDPRVMLDYSGIAKGFGVDVVANLLESKGIKNYIVEIGGEIDAHGYAPTKENNKDRYWRIGIDKPIDGSDEIDDQLQAVLKVRDCSMATSGNYRKFYYKNGKKYAHIIDPHSGQPVQHSVLSSTVIAEDCMTADAYAKVFMVNGIEKSIPFLRQHRNIDVYLIYVGKDEKLHSYMTSGMKKLVVKEE